MASVVCRTLGQQVPLSGWVVGSQLEGARLLCGEICGDCGVYGVTPEVNSPDVELEERGGAKSYQPPAKPSVLVAIDF